MNRNNILYSIRDFVIDVSVKISFRVITFREPYKNSVAFVGIKINERGFIVPNGVI